MNDTASELLAFCKNCDEVISRIGPTFWFHKDSGERCCSIRTVAVPVLASIREVKL